MKYLLDTNIISELIAKQPNNKVLDFLSSINESDTYLSVITIGEIKSGIENVQNIEKKAKLNTWFEQDLLVRFQNRIIDVDVNIMTTWGKINQKLKKMGRPLPIMDSIIGSTCKANNLILVTRNVNDFQNIDRDF